MSRFLDHAQTDASHSSGRVIGSQETHIRDPGGTRTRNSSKRAAADLRL